MLIELKPPCSPFLTLLGKKSPLVVTQTLPATQEAFTLRPCSEQDQEAEINPLVGRERLAPWRVTMP